MIFFIVPCYVLVGLAVGIGCRKRFDADESVTQ